MEAKATENQEETRSRIIDAAETRFRSYGYGKTTMAEIATDVGMSAANLYRFFENKLDIGAALAQRCFGEREKMILEVVNNPELTAAQKLEGLVLAILRYTHGQFSTEPKMNELVEIIITKRQDLVQNKINRDQELVIEILRQGQEAGDFVIDDLNRSAEAVRNATIKFCMPLFMFMYPLEEFERMAKEVVQLLLKGLEIND
jgi:AcrR family transcriptional regulator